MKTWAIYSSEGEFMGKYDAITEDGALDQMAQDAGYDSQLDAVERGIPEFSGYVKECPWEMLVG